MPELNQPVSCCRPYAHSPLTLLVRPHVPSSPYRVESNLELSVTELLAETRRPSFEGLRARQALSDRVAFIAFAPAFLLLGIHARRFSQRRGWRCGGGALAYAVAAFGAFPATWMIIAVQVSLRSRFYPADEIRLLQYWVLPFVAVVAAGVFARMAASDPVSSEQPSLVNRL